MRNAKHITHEIAYQQILADGCLRPKGRGFGNDWIAGDDRYIFLAVGSKYKSIMPDDRYSFEFDAHTLVAQGATVGIALGVHYDFIMHVAAAAVYAMLFLERMFGMAEGVIETNYHDLLYAATDPTDQSEAVEQVREIFRSDVKMLHQAYRTRGPRALEVLEHGDEDVEILVDWNLSLDLCIKHGKESK